jgi:hypothetical protein
MKKLLLSLVVTTAMSGTSFADNTAPTLWGAIAVSAGKTHIHQSSQIDLGSENEARNFVLEHCKQTRVDTSPELKNVPCKIVETFQGCRFFAMGYNKVSPYPWVWATGKTVNEAYEKCSQGGKNNCAQTSDLLHGRQLDENKNSIIKAVGGCNKVVDIGPALEGALVSVAELPPLFARACVSRPTLRSGCGSVGGICWQAS